MDAASAAVCIGHAAMAGAEIGQPRKIDIHRSVSGGKALESQSRISIGCRAAQGAKAYTNV